MQLDIAERANQTELCRRSYDIADFEFRSGDDGFTFEGVASVVDTPYTVRDRWGEFEETIRAGAFNKTLRDSGANVGLFVNHNHLWGATPLADRSSGTLTLTADPDLRVRATLDPDDPAAQSVRSAVNRGVMRQMSIGFNVPKARDKWNDDMTQREISEVALMETSIVWKGANPATSGKMRAVDHLLSLDFDLDEDEIRRAIAHFNSLLPTSVSDAAIAAALDEFAERDRLDRERLERKRHCPVA